MHSYEEYASFKYGFVVMEDIISHRKDEQKVIHK